MRTDNLIYATTPWLHDWWSNVQKPSSFQEGSEPGGLDGGGGGRGRWAPLYNFKTAHDTVTEITQNIILIIFNT